MIAQAVRAAEAAVPLLTAWTVTQRREVLYACADALEAARAPLVAELADETGLTTVRLTGELERTTGQLRLLGDYVAAGRHRSVRGSPHGGPGGADIRQVVVPVGPVAVFAASNFPLAFGVLGGDTASALAAGCPVVVKAHPAQPRASRLLAAAVAPVFAAWPGAFAVVEGGSAASIELVTSAGIKAVGFTGSLAGGRALMAAVATRAEPIPVYAEMGSINPVFVLPGAARDRTRIAPLAVAVTSSTGQLCTKPGLFVVPDSPQGRTFADELAGAVVRTPVHRMLTAAMAATHADWVAALAAAEGLDVRMGAGTPAPVVVVAPAAALANSLGGALVREHFGPAAVVALADPAAFRDIAARLEGQLTATVHAVAGSGDEAIARELLPVLVQKAGRVVWNGVPTGVAVVDAMQHGGPWPATSAPWSTSVGTGAIDRFQRPVALQGVPEAVFG